MCVKNLVHAIWIYKIPHCQGWGETEDYTLLGVQSDTGFWGKYSVVINIYVFQSSNSSSIVQSENVQRCQFIHKSLLSMFLTIIIWYKSVFQKWRLMNPLLYPYDRITSSY